jgi:hypothetical protein
MVLIAFQVLVVLVVLGGVSYCVRAVQRVDRCADPISDACPATLRWTASHGEASGLL